MTAKSLIKYNTYQDLVSTKINNKNVYLYALTLFFKHIFTIYSLILKINSTPLRMFKYIAFMFIFVLENK